MWHCVFPAAPQGHQQLKFAQRWTASDAIEVKLPGEAKPLYDYHQRDASKSQCQATLMFSYRLIPYDPILVRLLQTDT